MVAVSHPTPTTHSGQPLPLPSSSSSLPPSEVVYTTLIQTYLNLLCHDNATFLAERNAAQFPQSENAIYLLAYCYYRNGSVKAARSILLNRWLGRNASVSSTTTSDIELERTRSSARYLLAKCCYDLQLYSEAEETILKHARELFAQELCEGKGSINGVKIKGNRNEAMDAWIVSSSTSSSQTSSQCPIPNGSAGLYLLGNICRRTNRRQRAIEYYRLSLKLDPLMWTSYEAICELAGPEKDNTSFSVDGKGEMFFQADDPQIYFGVEPPKLSPRHTVKSMGMMGGGGGPGGHGFMSGVVASSGGGGGGDSYTTASDGRDQQSSMGSFQLNRYGTPSTPYTGFGKMNIGTNEFTTTEAANNTMHQVVGGNVNFNLPPTASTVAPRTRGGRQTGDGLPQTNLFAATPGLPPSETPANPPISTTVTKATPANVNHNNNAQSPPASAIGYADQVLDRARRVVAGITYEPSPESINYSATKNASQRRKARFANELTFSSTPMPLSSSTTPAQHSSSNTDSGPPPFHAGVSTVKGEKRALFTTTEEEDEDTETLSSRKKSPKKEERAKEEMTQTSSEEDDEGGVPKSTPSGGVGQLELDAMTQSEEVGKVLKLLCSIGAAYKYLCQFQSQDALELFRELPAEHINTGWVQHQIGKAYFEMSDYQNAQRALLTMQNVEPHRIKGLDILSTTLWQLKKEVELSDLAQRVVDFDRMAPEAWFVVGNCFSLQKEHETAITFFRRSIQLNPAYTYAHTLCGHEFTSNEDYEKAISCYRDAIRVDSRHFNAWYGLGAIYFRQEKFDLAEYHFQRALNINAQSSVLHCHLGMAQHQNGKTEEALETLAGAFALDPRNPQAHYQRATIFMTLDRPEDALSELEKVRSSAPKEASVHFNMGKVYKRLNQPAKAMRCFLTALDLDPKDNNLIKAAMDRLDEPDVEEEVSVF